MFVELVVEGVLPDSSTEITEESVEKAREFNGDDTTRFCNGSG